MNENDYILLFREEDNKVCLFILGNQSVENSTWAFFTNPDNTKKVTTKQNLTLKNIMDLGYEFVGSGSQDSIQGLKELDFTKSYYRMNLPKVLESAVQDYPEIFL